MVGGRRVLGPLPVPSCLPLLPGYCGVSIFPPNSLPNVTPCSITGPEAERQVSVDRNVWVSEAERQNRGLSQAKPQLGAKAGETPGRTA